MGTAIKVLVIVCWKPRAGTTFRGASVGRFDAGACNGLLDFIEDGTAVLFTENAFGFECLPVLAHRDLIQLGRTSVFISGGDIHSPSLLSISFRALSVGLHKLLIRVAMRTNGYPRPKNWLIA